MVESDLGAAPVEGLRRYLRRLREADEDTIGAVACREACDALGFSKAMFSRVGGPVWTPEHVYWRPEVGQGYDALRQAVDGTSVPLLRAPREADLVRLRRPYVLGRRAFHREAYRPLIDLSDPAAYAAAPIVAAGRTIAILHVDRNRDTVTDDDVSLLLMAARLAGSVMTRNGNRRRMNDRRTALVALVDSVMTGGEQPPELLSLFARDPEESSPTPENLSTPAITDRIELTEREDEVLALVAEGATNRHIATTLYVSEGTVKSHVRAIFGKLGVESRAQAAAYHRQHRAAAGGDRDR
ncbi:response regulator transcription factor [Gordonia sp. zg691]|nr:response regulator transcription factor [Gordonia jinghuaiqii]